MLALTPSERRGALVLVVLLLIGAGHDLWRAREAGDAAPGVGGRVPPSAPGGWEETSAPAAPAPVAPAVVPGAARGPGPDSTPGQAARTPGAARAPLDLNRADARELDALPGVGPVLAGRIVLQRQRYGPFRGVDELLAVPGVGPRLLERIRPWATVGPSREATPPGALASPDSAAAAHR